MAVRPAPLPPLQRGPLASAPDRQELGRLPPRQRRPLSMSRRCRVAPPTAGSSSSSGGTGRDGPFFPDFSALMSCHRTRKAIDSAS